jgi:hypothetical protein
MFRRWKCHVGSVKTLQFHVANFQAALAETINKRSDNKIKSEQ